MVSSGPSPPQHKRDRPFPLRDRQDRLTDEEVRVVLATCQGNGLVDIWDRVMLSLFAYCAGCNCSWCVGPIDRKKINILVKKLAVFAENW